MTAYPYIYSWRNNSKREIMFGRLCRVVERSAKNSALIEFADNGQREVVSRNAIRRANAGGEGRKPALLAAAVKVRDILLEECRQKATLDPFEHDINLDYHVSVTISVGEIRAFAEAVNVAANRPICVKARKGGEK